MMLISYAITVHNEGEYIKQLLSQLTDHIAKHNTNDEIVILDDESTDDTTVSILADAEKNGVKVYKKKFDGDFALHKNYLNSLCKGDYIFQIDADEYFAPYLLENIHLIVKSHPTVELFLIPRVNTVEGLTQEHIQKWGWTVNEKGYVMWPDYQTRLYKNIATIRWAGKVHERIRGAQYWTALPDQEPFALFHKKTIARQEQQNALYSTIQ